MDHFPALSTTNLAQFLLHKNKEMLTSQIENTDE